MSAITLIVVGVMAHGAVGLSRPRRAASARYALGTLRARDRQTRPPWSATLLTPTWSATLHA